jgi:hypothetical protein
MYCVTGDSGFGDAASSSYGQHVEANDMLEDLLKPDQADVLHNLEQRRSRLLDEFTNLHFRMEDEAYELQLDMRQHMIDMADKLESSDIANMTSASCPVRNGCVMAA